MFTYLTIPLQRFWLIGLLLLWAVLLFGGFIFGQDAQKIRRMPAWTRLTSSIVLVVAGWSWYLFSRQQPFATTAWLIALGMTLGFVGDLFMAGLLGGKRAVLGGIGAFGLGHIAYILAFWPVGNRLGLDNPAARWGGLILWLLIGGLGWYAIVFRGQKPTMLHRAALPYALLLASTAGVAAGLALQAAGFVPLALGTALFLLSDLLIAAQLFNGRSFPYIGDIIWLTYGPAQALIVYAVGVIWKLGG